MLRGTNASVTQVVFKGGLFPTHSWYLICTTLFSLEVKQLSMYLQWACFMGLSSQMDGTFLAMIVSSVTCLLSL